jgi:putative spermidine/putrescine transport system substrate-binding protein/spermidine/putrescine transport system substrate-binding protein
MMLNPLKLAITFLLFIAPFKLFCTDEVLKIAGWDAYADPHNTKKTIGYKSFEEKYGVRIEFTALNSLDAIIEVAESDQEYDLFIISNEGISILYDMSLIKPLELNKIRHYQSLQHNLKYTSWAQFDSQVYAVPWSWGPTGLMYDKNLDLKPDSWETLWDTRHKGKVAMWDDVSMIWTTALLLGYKNVYNLTKEQLEAVREKLFRFNDLNGYYYKGGGDEIDLAKNGKIVAYNSWFDPSQRLRLMGKDFEMTIPKEGAVGMFDSYLISSRSKHDATAYRYIDHQISPEIQLKMVRTTGLAPANIETLGLLRPDEIHALHLNDPEYFNKMILWNNMPRKNLYEDVLQKVRADYKKKSKVRR